MGNTMLAADLTIHKDSLELEKINWEAVLEYWDNYDRWADDVSKQVVSNESTKEQQLLFEHLNRKCTCGSGDIWSECNGIEGDTSYCG